MDDSLVLRLMLASGLGVALTGALASVVVSALRRRDRHRLLAPTRVTRPAWDGTHVAFAVFAALSFMVCLSVIQTGLSASGFFTTLYGPDFPLGMPENGGDEHRAAATIRHLWASALFFPFHFAALLLLPRVFGLGNPLHVRGWSSAAVAGYLTWLVATPAALCVFVLAGSVHHQLTGLDPQRHPLTMLGDLATRRDLRILFLLQTVVIAPIVEEWLFRGVILPWLAQKKVAAGEGFSVPPRYRSLFMLLAAVAIGTLFSMGDDGTRWLANVRGGEAGDPATAAAHLIPPIFFLLLIPVDFLMPLITRRWMRSPQPSRAVWASAALFAAVHSHVWPSPVPLMVLAIGIGYLYLKTRSLVGPIVVHSLFNAVSATYVLLAPAT